MGWSSEDEVRQRVADRQKLASVNALEPSWDSIISDACERAQNEITEAFARRGYSATQVEAWPSLASYHRRLALYWALTDGQLLGSSQEKEYLSRLDCRSELAGVVLTGADGLISAPATPSIGHGSMKSEGDTFRDTEGNWRPW